MIDVRFDGSTVWAGALPNPFRALRLSPLCGINRSTQPQKPRLRAVQVKSKGMMMTGRRTFSAAPAGFPEPAVVGLFESSRIACRCGECRLFRVCPKFRGAAAESFSDARRPREPGGDMKRTATTLALLAGFGGGCVSPGSKTGNTPGGGMPQAAEQPAKFGAVTRGQQNPAYQGPYGEPVLAGTSRGAMPTDAKVQQAAPFRPYVPPGAATSPNTVAVVPGMSNVRPAAYTGNMANGQVMQASGFGPQGCGPGGFGGPGGGGSGLPGILPVPGMGPPGAVAASGGGRRGGRAGDGRDRVLPGGRASIKFTGPAGMKVTWQTPGGGVQRRGHRADRPEGVQLPPGSGVPPAAHADPAEPPGPDVLPDAGDCRRRTRRRSRSWPTRRSRSRSPTRTSTRPSPATSW